MDDLDHLAKHVDESRANVDLPIGQPPEWLPSSRDVITIAPSASSHPDRPPVYIADYSDFSKLSVKAVQDILRDYPVIIVNNRPTYTKFDHVGLSQFGDLQSLRVMHGRCKA